MPSAAVLLVALIGGTILGLVGAVMAIPLAATVKVAMSRTPTEPDEPPPDPGAAPAHPDLVPGEGSA
jgi:predicted PurR-regulated permease PerM